VLSWSRGSRSWAWALAGIRTLGLRIGAVLAWGGLAWERWLARVRGRIGLGLAGIGRGAGLARITSSVGGWWRRARLSGRGVEGSLFGENDGHGMDKRQQTMGCGVPAVDIREVHAAASIDVGMTRGDRHARGRSNVAHRRAIGVLNRDPDTNRNVVFDCLNHYRNSTSHVEQRLAAIGRRRNSRMKIRIIVKHRDCIVTQTVLVWIHTQWIQY